MSLLFGLSKESSFNIGLLEILFLMLYMARLLSYSFIEIKLYSQDFIDYFNKSIFLSI